MSLKKELVNDPRFTRISKDPRFWEMPENERKVKIDKRFRAMFHDKKFKLKYTVDKRGRPVHCSSTEDMKRFYALSDSDSDLSEDEKKTKGEKAKPKGEGAFGKSGNKNSEKGKGVINDSSASKVDASKKEGQQRKSQKNLKGTNATEFPQDKAELAPKKQRAVSVESTGFPPKASQKILEHSAKATEGHRRGGRLDSERTETAKEGDFSAAHVSKNDVESKIRPELEESATSGETEEEDESEDSGDLEEDSSSGDEGAAAEESNSEDGGEAGEESETDGDEEDSGPDLARGKGNLETSSEDEEEDLTGIQPKEPEVVHDWGELAKDAPRAEKVTHRLAVCNMDWDRLKAKDLLALLSSFTPKGGVVFSVKIYPSEFGKERMKEEEVNGPTELLSLPADVTEKDSISKERLRDYQFKRLKYFYAVVECDSAETANKIYEECDGLEFESSCSFVDLRFIPDDVTFDGEPRDVASETDGAPYKPKLFTSAAVTTSKVDITWDETDHERVASLSRTFKKDDLLDMDFQAYLASSSEGEEEEPEEGVTPSADPEDCKHHPKDEEEQIAKYRELLQSIQEKEKRHPETDMEMEIKWVPGLKETAEEMVKNKLEGKSQLTPWEQFLEKKKEKRKMKKKKQKAAAAEEISTDDEHPSDVDLDHPYFAEEMGKPGLSKKSKKLKREEEAQGKEDLEKHKAEMALLLMDEEEEGGRSHFHYDQIVQQQNLSKRKKKLLMKKGELLTDDFQVNVADARFQAMYTSHLFNLDPSDPNFKKTKAVEKILEEKARRRQQGNAEAAKDRERRAEKETVAKKSVDPALSMLIKSVKNKTEQFQARKKQKVK